MGTKMLRWWLTLDGVVFNSFVIMFLQLMCFTSTSISINLRGVVLLWKVFLHFVALALLFSVKGPLPSFVLHKRLHILN